MKKGLSNDLKSGIKTLSDATISMIYQEEIDRYSQKKEEFSGIKDVIAYMLETQKI